MHIEVHEYVQIVVDNIKIFIEILEDSKSVCTEFALTKRLINCDIHTSLNKCILLEIVSSTA